jgi:2,4-dienoyl-CoA reductase-like NADH-dependent reductase (Old Yellow Enzyme family)
MAVPRAMTEAEIAEVVEAHAETARRAVRAGYRVVEVHAAHGYLLHEFLSPLSNTRTDSWGGGFEGRTRVVREVVAAVRAACRTTCRCSSGCRTPTGWTEAGRRRRRWSSPAASDRSAWT